MDLRSAIMERTSRRKYEDIPVDDAIIEQLEAAVWECNRSADLNIKLKIGDGEPFTAGKSYGMFSGVQNYFAMIRKKDDPVGDEKIGYYGEKLVLLAQTLGLNSCWAGLSYRKIAGTYELADGEKIGCYIALGYGETQGKGHKVKDVKEVSNASDVSPKWFNKGVDAAILAPTAVNQQKFYLEYLGFRDYSKVPKVAAKPLFSMVGYSKMDLGIVKYHFELGAGKENFEWA